MPKSPSGHAASVRRALVLAAALLVVLVGSLWVAGPALAQTPCEPYSQTCPTTPPETVTDPGDPGDPTDPLTPLAGTGADIAFYAVTGVVAILAGTALARRYRTRTD